MKKIILILFLILLFTINCKKNNSIIDNTKHTLNHVMSENNINIADSENITVNSNNIINESYFIISENGIIIGYNGTDTDVIIPEEINNIKVTGIADDRINLFTNKGLTSVIMPEGIVSIGWNAFRQNQLEKIIIPDSVMVIGPCAFSDNPLASITIGNNVILGGSTPPAGYFEASFSRSFDDYYNSGKIAGIYLFNGDKWERMGNIFENDFEINEIGIIIAYYGNATSIIIPDKVGGKTVTAIGNGVFRGKGLESVIIPSSVYSIGEYAFFDNKLKTITIPDRVTTIGDYAFSKNKLYAIIIPAFVNSIGRGVFYNNNLTSIYIPDSVASISYEAFSYNPLENISIGNNVEIYKPEMASDGLHWTFDYNFDILYNDNGRKAGIYIAGETLDEGLQYNFCPWNISNDSRTR